MPPQGRRAPGYIPRFAGREWDSLTGSLLDDALRRLQDNYSGVPGGFFGITPSTIQAGVTADSRTEVEGWAAADHVHDAETATPVHAVGPVASEGTGTALMRADATIAMGIVEDPGDILVSDGDTAVALPVGDDRTVLMADSAEPAGLRWVKGAIWKMTHRTVDADTTITLEDTIVLFDAAGGAVSCFLPPAVDAEGRSFRIAKLNATGPPNVTVVPDGADTINGAASVTLVQQYNLVVVFSDGTQWYAFP